MTNRDASKAGVAATPLAQRIVWLFLVCIHPQAIPAAPQGSKAASSLPEGAGKAVIMAKCQFCHTNDRVVAARLTKDGWAESINRMIELGAPIAPDEATALVNYLTANFGTNAAKAPAAPPAAKGNATPSALTTVFATDPDQAAYSPVGSLKNVEMFALSGDPSNPAPFSVLLRISPGGVVPANWLFGNKTIACLRGDIEFIEVNDLNTSPRKTLHAGAVLHITGDGRRSLGETKGGAVVLLTGQGPLPATMP